MPSLVVIGSQIKEKRGGGGGGGGHFNKIALPEQS